MSNYNVEDLETQVLDLDTNWYSDRSGVMGYNIHTYIYYIHMDLLLLIIHQTHIK